MTAGAGFSDRKGECFQDRPEALPRAFHPRCPPMHPPDYPLNEAPGGAIPFQPANDMFTDVMAGVLAAREAT